MKKKITMKRTIRYNIDTIGFCCDLLYIRGKEFFSEKSIPICAKRLRMFFDLPSKLPHTLWITFSPFRFNGSSRVDIVRTKLGEINRLVIDGKGFQLVETTEAFLDSCLPKNADRFFVLIEYK